MTSVIQHSILIGLVTAFASSSFADNSCFSDPAVQKRIADAQDLDSCFASEAGAEKCHLAKLSAREQIAVNSLRLTPFDRTTDKLLNQATGLVSAKVFGSSDVMPGESSGQKISRCHIITSAHLLYTRSYVSTTSEDLASASDQRVADLSFYSGQSCDSGYFSSKTPAKVFFKMTRRGSDIECANNEKACEYRDIRPDADIMILRLETYDKQDRTFFKLHIRQIQSSQLGRRVNCWGYPGKSPESSITDKLSHQLLWHQTNAKIYQISRWRISTTAVSYPGMSGGGCVFPEDPDQLVGIHAMGGSPPTLVPLKDGNPSITNTLSPLTSLAKRYRAATGKSIEDLDKECD